MIDALVGLLRSLGGEIRCEAEVDQVLIENNHAVGVSVGGERYEADRAVVANLTPTVLFGNLVEKSAVPVDFARKVSRYRYAPGTVMVHLALSDLPRWRASDRAREHAYVHIGPYLDDMALAYQQAVSGLLPTQPTLVVGQPTAIDPSRAPHGKHILWVQVRMVPAKIRGDGAGEITATTWAEAKEPFADRVMAILEQYAPGIGLLVLGRAVMSPEDLESANPNLVGGDQLGGSHHLSQHFFLRPFPGWTRYATPVDGLYMCGAGTWPGAGVGAGSGYLLGKQLKSKRRRIGRRP
jgi:phytoene dehydrogenase-like protein